ncbi:unnamed protein product [marine sediment metagenome]|uniref:Uncharacterized protein n=1 Tax=marine sediment metagenome TaxID=412755 RepID=X1D354_9ZZZZ
MSKSMRIQVLMEPELLTKAKNYAVEHKIEHKNDSQLIRNILFKGITDLADMELTIYLVKQQLEEKKKEVGSLTVQLNHSSTYAIELQKENEILKKNLETKVKRKVKK